MVAKDRAEAGGGRHRERRGLLWGARALASGLFHSSHFGREQGRVYGLRLQCNQCQNFERCEPRALIGPGTREWCG
jgi:hypothetical protein